MLVREKFSWCYFGGSYLDNEREFKHGTKCQTSTINSIFYSFSLILKNSFFVLKKLFETQQNSARMAEFCQAGKNPLFNSIKVGHRLIFLSTEKQQTTVDPNRFFFFPIRHTVATRNHGELSAIF